jgi:hypothetical protein
MAVPTVPSPTDPDGQDPATADVPIVPDRESAAGRLLWITAMLLAVAAIVGCYILARRADDWTAGVLPLVGYLLVAAIALSILATRAVRQGALAVTVVTLFLSVLLVPSMAAGAMALGWRDRVMAALQDFQNSLGMDPTSGTPQSGTDTSQENTSSASGVSGSDVPIPAPTSPGHPVSGTDEARGKVRLTTYGCNFRSMSEAKAFLKAHPDAAKQIDQDGDGRPCEDKFAPRSRPADGSSAGNDCGSYIARLKSLNRPLSSGEIQYAWVECGVSLQ